MKTVILPKGEFISPGLHHFHISEIVSEENWWMGHLIGETTRENIEIVDFDVEAPPMGERRQFTLFDRTFTVVRDDDRDFWGRKIIVKPTQRTMFTAEGSAVLVWNSNPDDPINQTIVTDDMTREEWLIERKIEHIEALYAGERAGWWIVGEDGNPHPAMREISIAAMRKENKTLMAHLMVDLGFFNSVGNAKKNGWDKPLEFGIHELGPKKKRIKVKLIE